MVNPQLIDYINTQLAQNVSQDQLKTDLIASGWQPQDIEAAFASLTPVKIFPLILASIAGVALVSGLSFYGFQKLLPPKNISLVTSEASPSLSPTLASPAASTNPTTVSSNCDSFPDKLGSCTPFKCQFIHPFANTPLEREIIGIEGDKCHYVEQMPNNGIMECKYPENTRFVVAKYLQDGLQSMSEGKSMGGAISVDFTTGESTNTTTIDDQVVDDPLLKALNDGTCVISGYPNPTPL